MTYARAMRLGVYTDYAYRRREDGVQAERAFALFVAGLADHFDRVVLFGRLRPAQGDAPGYGIGGRIQFVELPYYERLSDPLRAIPAQLRSLGVYWRALDELDVVWLLGPHPLAIVFALLARLRGRRVVLGVRQDLPEYTRRRHPGRRMIGAAATILDAVFRLLARRMPVAVVGPYLSRRYAGSPQLLELTVSLVEEEDIAEEETAKPWPAGDQLTVLTVGRLETEKNPLLLADVLAALEASEPGRWRLVVCGEGPMEGELRARLRDLGVEERAELRGYVPFGPELQAAYRSADLFLHVSWTEGMPQVLVESLAAGLPTVATEVGGVGLAMNGLVGLIPPGDAAAAALALEELAGNPERRANAHQRRSRLRAEPLRLRPEGAIGRLAATGPSHSVTLSAMRLFKTDSKRRERGASRAADTELLAVARERISEVVDAASRAAEEIRSRADAQDQGREPGQKIDRGGVEAELARALADRAEKLSKEANELAEVLTRAQARLTKFSRPEPDSAKPAAPEASKGNDASPNAGQPPAVKPPGESASQEDADSGQAPQPKRDQPRAQAALQARLGERFVGRKEPLDEDESPKEPLDEDESAKTQAEVATPEDAQNPTKGPSSEGIRLLANQMAVAGSSRPEIERRLKEDFGVTDPDRILFDIFGPGAAAESS